MQAYDRNKFLQANFRFLVSDAVDTRKFESDADLMLDWEDVVQVCDSRYVPAASLRLAYLLVPPLCSHA